MKSIYILCLAIFSVTLVALQKAPVKLPKKFKKEFAFIPSGLVVLEKDTFSLQSYFISKTEVTNGDYQLFLNALKEKNDTMKLKIAKVVQENWTKEFEATSSFEPMAKNYFEHPAYEDYPVVNISQAAAELYCEWLEETLNEASPDLNLKVRLPFHAEIIRAGVGEQLMQPYPWGGPYLRNSKGCYLLNYNPSEEGDTTSHMYSDGTFFTSKVTNYNANEFGVFNLCGNVSEMINEDGIAVGGSWIDTSEGVLLRSRKEFDKVSATVGFRPVFTYSTK